MLKWEKIKIKLPVKKPLEKKLILIFLKMKILIILRSIEKKIKLLMMIYNKA